MTYFRVWISEKRSEAGCFPHVTQRGATRSGVRDRQTFLPLMSRPARWKRCSFATSAGGCEIWQWGSHTTSRRCPWRDFRGRILRVGRNNRQRTSKQKEEGEAVGLGWGQAGDYCLLWPSFTPSLPLPTTKQKVRGIARKTPHVFFRRHHTHQRICFPKKQDLFFHFSCPQNSRFRFSQNVEYEYLRESCVYRAITLTRILR